MVHCTVLPEMAYRLFSAQKAEEFETLNIMLGRETSNTTAATHRKISSATNWSGMGLQPHQESCSSLSASCCISTSERVYIFINHYLHLSNLYSLLAPTLHPFPSFFLLTFKVFLPILFLSEIVQRL